MPRQLSPMDQTICSGTRRSNPCRPGSPIPLVPRCRSTRGYRELILDGALGPVKPLPASRTLAASLGISRDTIEAAYGQLHAEGFIERRVGNGSFVADMTEFTPGRRCSHRDSLMRN